MKRHWILILMVIMAVFAFQACQNKQDANDEQAANEPYEEPPADTAQTENDAPGVADEATDDMKDTADRAADSETAQDMEQTLEEAGSEVTDAGITTAVKAKFAVDEVVKAANIDVDTENGIVTLNGTVATERESNRAVEIAESVDGVKRVQNRLTVSPS